MKALYVLPLAVVVTGCASINPALLGLSINPEIGQPPVFSDQKLAGFQQELMANHEALRVNGFQFPVATEVPCQLRPKVLWQTMYGADSRDAYLKNYRANIPANTDMQYSIDELQGRLLSGRCVNGQPEGDFEMAIQSKDQSSIPPSFTMSTTADVRFKGSMRSGRLTGNLYQARIAAVNSTGKPTITYIQSVTPYRQGKPVDTSLQMSWGMPRHGTTDQFQMLMSNVTQHAANNTAQTKNYMGRILASESQSKDGKLDGLMTSYGYVFYVGHAPSQNSQICYKNGGQQTSLSACGVATTVPGATLAAAVSAAAPTTGSASASGSVSRPSLNVINNSSGLFLSPITSDGVVAEWVEKSVNVGLGSSLGGAAGAYAGQKALENVPFVGGLLGQRMGAAAGRRAALQSVGGEAYMRETTDISFNSIQDMARWLKQEHGTHPRLSEILSATNKIYPELMPAFGSLR